MATRIRLTIAALQPGGSWKRKVLDAEILTTRKLKKMWVVRDTNHDFSTEWMPSLSAALNEYINHKRFADLIERLI